MTKIYCGSMTNAVKVIDSATGSISATVTMGVSNTWLTKVSPDGNYCAVTFLGTNSVQFITVATNVLSSVFPVTTVTGFFASIVWAPDSSKVYLGGGNGVTSMTPSGSQGPVWAGSVASANHMAISSDGTRLYFSGGTTGVKQIDTSSGTTLNTWLGVMGSVFACALSPDNATLYVARDTSPYNVYSVVVASGAITTGAALVATPSDIAITPDGTSLFYPCSAGGVKRVATSGLTISASITVPHATSAGMFNDGSQVWVSDYDDHRVYPITIATNAVGTYTDLTAGSAQGVAPVPVPLLVNGTVTMSIGKVTVAATGTRFIGGHSSTVVGPVRVAVSQVAVTGCARKAWLVLGTEMLQLEDLAAGYVCQSLDLGYPAVREVKSNRPDQDGIIDRTTYMGERVVTANITALVGAGARIDEVAQAFAPYMAPAARPILHYRLDTPLAVERTLTLRGSGYAWPVVGPFQRDINLQWVAADPVARDPNTKSATATLAAPGTITTPGDVAVRPLFRINGPITAPVVTMSPPLFPPWKLAFVSGFVLAAGHFIDIDTDARTVFLDADRSQPRLSSIDWTQSSWQWVPPATATSMALAGSATSGSTQVRATWQDGYFT